MDCQVFRPMMQTLRFDASVVSEVNCLKYAMSPGSFQGSAPSTRGGGRPREWVCEFQISRSKRTRTFPDPQTPVASLCRRDNDLKRHRGRDAGFNGHLSATEHNNNFVSELRASRLFSDSVDKIHGRAPTRRTNIETRRLDERGRERKREEERERDAVFDPPESARAQRSSAMASELSQFIEKELNTQDVGEDEQKRLLDELRAEPLPKVRVVGDIHACTADDGDVLMTLW